MTRTMGAAIGSAGKKGAALTRLVLVICLGGAISAISSLDATHAAEVRAFAVSRNADTYYIRFDAVVVAPAQLVYERLADYAHLDKLSSVITSIKVDGAPDGKSDRVRSVLRSCFLLFCREVVQVEDVTEPDSRTILAHMVPGQGDFTDGRCVWRITDNGDRTRLHYEATRTIAFWIPPLIGPWIVKQTMREYLESSMAALERIANQPAGSRR